jgi:hypothetical protein
MYKITFEMLSPIIYYDLPIFDSIIAYCKYKEQMGVSDFHTPHGAEIIEFELPLKKHELGFYLASYMCFDGSVEGEDAWRKQWESKYDDIVDFGKTRKRINVGSGRFKSYDIPFVTQHNKQIWFYFDGDKDIVSQLISSYLNGIGKKSIIGYGNFADFVIEPSEEEQMVYYRPMPISAFMHTTGFHCKTKQGRYKPPYWLPATEKVLIPSFLA